MTRSVRWGRIRRYVAFLSSGVAVGVLLVLGLPILLGPQVRVSWLLVTVLPLGYLAGVAARRLGWQPAAFREGRASSLREDVLRALVAILPALAAALVVAALTEAASDRWWRSLLAVALLATAVPVGIALRRERTHPRPSRD
ncbi:hypothetical protein [Micromonospora yangpuensis]|uniref:hypothetical protein n=1 Tax=Micromonospora yangpuensis TaxID=683228 RepID=UPI001112EAF1|nr:hypothetical protein [Micromonospora yangpuensis]